jgi:erythronate-4-phosphate dehydrogenase
MKIVADENMPLVKDFFSEYGQVELKAGRQLNNTDVLDADILLVRSVTQVNEALLKNSKVKFVATATIGKDHLDSKYLNEKNIVWNSAPGCNADSVAEYVVSIVAYLVKHKSFNLKNKKVGIVGCGNVGSRVKKRIEILGMKTVCYDPPKEIRENDFKSSQLDDLYDCDLLCLHAPLTYEDDHPSFHLIEKGFFEKFNQKGYVISAGRGPVIDFNSLKNVDLSRFVLDVWEPEPEVNIDIMNECLIATPHVAGYSMQSKWRGTEMVYKHAAKEFGWNGNKKVNYPIEQPRWSLESCNDWADCVLALYDPVADSEKTKKALCDATDCGDSFDKLRKEYSLRHEFYFPKFININLDEEDKNICKNLGFNFDS